MQVGADDGVRGLGGGCDPAADLWGGDLPGEERERHRRVVAGLHLQARPVDRAAIEAGGRACLQATEAQVEGQQTLRQTVGWRLAVAAGGGLFLAPMDQPAQEGAGGEHHGARHDAAAVTRDDPGHPAIVHDQVLDGTLDHLEIGCRPDRGLHRLAVELAVGLGARSLHRGSLGAVEQSELDAGRIRDPPHQTVERIDLTHQMALAEAADRWVTGHLADGGELVRHQRGARAHAGRGSRSLAAGMAAADNDDVKN